MRTRRKVVAVVVTVAAIREVHRRLRGANRRMEEVRYRVPGGQDPAAVLASLRVEGLPARPAVSAGESHVIISLDGRSRDEIREILRTAPVNLQGDPRTAGRVWFTDEVRSEISEKSHR